MFELPDPPAAALPARDHLSILVVGQDDLRPSTLMHSLVPGRSALVAWETGVRRARAAMAAMRFDVVLADAVLPDGLGVSLVADRADPRQQWRTVLLADEDCGMRTLAQRRGVFAVVGRTDGPDALLEALRRAIDRPVRATPSRTVPAAPRCARRAVSGREAPEPLVGESPAMHRLREQVRRLAPVPADVLVTGETGTGKDLLARLLHSQSGRPGTFVAVNCGAIPETLFESELFGHEAGAFTGASKARPGKIEQADRGTLFLDEVESMPPSQQVKLLRVLESRSVERVGGTRSVALDIRVIAAAQSSLEESCRQGRFRADLWHRLNVVSLTLPSLRERMMDVPALFEHFLDDACCRFGVDRPAVSDADLDRLMRHDWPGNVRELKHGAERFALGLDMLAATAPAQCLRLAAGLALQVGRSERDLIRSALERHGARLRDVAEELGISVRTLTRRIATYGLRDAGRSLRAAARSGDLWSSRPK